ncbi:formate dehydrogenase accessory sulfurtransferase FdhD [Chromobacterium sp. IIBBL 290-4]|uniref:formate dehydrogenase accessory sulfurtransferase FdhD n=1 Tax=Chromobacterium sp. IIBBL 290-4 TaxID=2953890 RepID=UPI0020B7AF4B|nr:formate dehydrogenase accessory sulfurtransferase FdhD [Chromobacterium sp. IIBBL 290-4]UTH72979.1 formate dehydrogenase accessory sulfurtransferase FdhD [Chromobacterium sp. IIBBL 290-4]
MDKSDSEAKRGAAALAVRRHRDGECRADQDRVAEETPVALVFNGISHAVMMATPLDLEQLAIGFALTEGIVSRAAEIFDVEAEFVCGGAEVRLEIAQPAFLALKDKRRSLAGRTGCGVCGIESLGLLDLQPERLSSPRMRADAAAISRAASELPRWQALMKETGGVHAAAWCAPAGEVLRVFEDVGRHNALDKLIGQLTRDGEDMGRGFVFMSSRASYELTRKCARMGIPLLATISAPTSLAVDIARQAGMTLASFCRQNGFVEYTADDAQA